MNAQILNVENISLKFINYTYADGKSVKVMQSIADRKNIERRTLLINFFNTSTITVTPNSVAKALIAEALEFTDHSAINVIDCGTIVPANSANATIYCVFNSEKVAQRLSQLYRLDIPVSKNQSVRGSVQLMTDSLIYLRVKNVPPCASIADLFNFANDFGVPKLLEQEMSDHEIFTDAYIIIVEPQTDVKRAKHQQQGHGEIICKGVTYRVQFLCVEATKRFCISCSNYDSHPSNSGCMITAVNLFQQNHCEENSVNDGEETNSKLISYNEEGEESRIPCQNNNIEAYIEKVQKHDPFALVSCETCSTQVLKADDGTGMCPGMPIWAPSRWDQSFHQAHEFKINSNGDVTLVCKNNANLC